jgi:hypothetical protein
MTPETAGESPPQEEELSPLQRSQVVAMLVVNRLDPDAMNGDWLAGTEGVASFFLLGHSKSLAALKPVRHYAERLRASNSAPCAALTLQLSDPEAVAAWDRMADEYNTGLLVRAQQAEARGENLETIARGIVDFVQRVKVLANSKR